MPRSKPHHHEDKAHRGLSPGKILGVMRRALAISSVFVLPLSTGCVYALHPYNTPSQEKLRIQTSSPAHYVVRVADTQDYPVAATGCVTFDVPRLPRSCAVYVFGLVKVSDDR